MLGTPYYLSPEICRNEEYDHKTDIWMLGCVIYEMATMNRPFQGESLNVILFIIFRLTFLGNH